MLKLLKKVLKENDVQSEIDAQIVLLEKIENQMNLLVDKLLQGILNDKLYATKNKQLEVEKQQILEKICELELKKEKGSEAQERIKYIEKAIIERNMFETLTVNMMLEEIERIVIYPTYLEIEFSGSKILGIDNYDLLDRQDKMKIEYGNLFNYRLQQKDELQKIIDFIKKKPNTTAKELAKECGVSVSGMQQRMTRLRKAGRIRFVGKAGKGYWEVINE